MFVVTQCLRGFYENPLYDLSYGSMADFAKANNNTATKIAASLSGHVKWVIQTGFPQEPL